MFPRHVFLIVLILFSSLIAYGQQVEWLTDIDAAKNVARTEGKPMLFDFWATWCGPCKAMEKNFWPRPEVIEFSKRFVCVKVNLDRNKGFAGKYGVSAIPNVVFTDPWGHGLTNERGFGAATAEDILKKVKILPTDFAKIKDAGNILETDDKNLDALHTVADFYQERKLYWQGTEFLKRIVKLELDSAKRENALVNLAFNHIRLDQPDDAIDRFEKLQKEFAESKQGDLFLYGLMYAYIRKNKLQNAEKNLLALKSKFPASNLIPQAEKNLQDAVDSKETKR